MTTDRIEYSGAAFRAASSFADAIRTTPEWEEWEAARAAAKSDASLQQLVNHYRELAARANRDPVMGARREVRAEVERLRNDLQGHPATVRQQAAIEGLTGLFMSLNDALTDELGVDFVALARPARGAGCCG